MKTLYLIGGTMGVGKTTVCCELKEILPNSVMLDGDWCWDMHPFTVNEETKRMVVDNICHMLNNFLKCSAFENIIFCWVMHEQSIIDDIQSRLERGNYRIVLVSLVCNEAALRQRLEADVAAGIRKADILDRSPTRLLLYDRLNTIKIDTSCKTVEQIAIELAKL